MRTLILMTTAVLATTLATGCACTGAFHGPREDIGVERINKVSVTWSANASCIDCIRMERSRGHGRRKITEVRHEGPRCPTGASTQWVEVRR